MAIQFVQTVDLGGNRIINLGAPSGGNDVATKTYVDTLLGTAISGLAWVEPARVASTGDVSLTGTGAVDGVTLATGDRVLLKSQTDPIENGVYVFDGTDLARATDDLDSGSVVAVNEGTANADKLFLLTTDGPVTVGTTPLTFSAVPGAVAGTTYTAGTAIDLTGDAIAVKYGAGLKIDGGGLLAFDNTVLPAALGKYAANIGDGAADTITVTHNLNTFDVHVTVYDNAGNKTDVWTEVRRTGVNAVQIVFGTAPAAGAYRVVVIG